MLTHEADLVKLSSFMHLQDGALFHSDPDETAGIPNAEALSWDAHGLRWGFGFSLVHKSKLRVGISSTLPRACDPQPQQPQPRVL